MNLPLKGKVAFITDGAPDIGEGMTRAFATEVFAKYERIDIVVNDAIGLRDTPENESP